MNITAIMIIRTRIMTLKLAIIAIMRHPQAILRGRDWKAQVGLVMSVGLRPCSGALVVLAFALSQDLLPAGIAATFLMGLGHGNHRFGVGQPCGLF